MDRRHRKLSIGARLWSALSVIYGVSALLFGHHASVMMVEADSALPHIDESPRIDALPEHWDGRENQREAHTPVVFKQGITPGRLLSIEYEGRMQPTEINTSVAELYQGYRAPRARYSVDIYWIRYESVYPDGAAAPITAQFFIPRYEDTSRRSVYVFGPGSTGLRDSCRASREHIAGIRWGLYRSHVLSHAGQGSVGIMPDYMGFGDPDRLQYYMVAQSEARVLLDAFRALNNFITAERITGIDGTAHFVGGFSQGGHAAFAAADYRQRYAPEIPLHGVLGYGPTTNLFALFKEYPDVAPMVLFTYRNLYGIERVNPDVILSQRFAKTLDVDLLRMCVGAMQSYYPIDPQELFTTHFSSALRTNRLATVYPATHRLIAANNTGLGGHEVPVLIQQGTNDIVVYQSSQSEFVRQLRARGSSVDYQIIDGARHDTRQIGFFDARAWIEQRTRAVELR